MAPKTIKNVAGRNAIPADIAAQGFTTLVNPTPTYYAPRDAGPLCCVIVDRTTQPSRDQGKADQVVYHGLVLKPFTNGISESTDPATGEVTDTKQSDCAEGDIIRITERHQLQNLDQYLRRACAVLIIPDGKIASKRNPKQTVWLFKVFARLLTDSERAQATKLISGQGPSAPMLLSE